MPFVFLTAGKSNFITAVTGISHERLQVFHRWISYTFFVTALVHTFPFIVYNIRTHQMVMQWYTNLDYWTGVVAILAQAYLTFASISPLRYAIVQRFMISKLMFEQKFELRVVQVLAFRGGTGLHAVPFLPLRIHIVILGLLHRHWSLFRSVLAA